MAQTRVPALRVMENALAATAENGHENEGSLSYSHGFLPVTPPILALPASHAAWDQVANSTAEMMRTYSVRRRLEEMPLLSASVEDLPDEYLLRASSMFSIFAHLYWYAQPDEPTNGLPSQMQQPWEEISRRLDRPAPHLSFIDLNSYNWKFIDPQAEQPFMVDNLELVVPMMGNEDERRFQMVPVEFLYEVRPVLQAVIHAQEAVRDNNIDVLKETLVQVGDLLKRLTYGTFMKVDPNIYSGRTYVNPVVWGKTAAPLASPYEKGIPGPSGTAIPAFHTLDFLLGRRHFKTTIGHEADVTIKWFPRFWQEWIYAVAEVSIPDFVLQSGDRDLQGIFDEARNAYAGESGLLNRHRIKAYGYLDLSFKAGRNKTLGGTEGDYSTRVWDKMDTELESARMERYHAFPQSGHMVPIKRVETIRDHEHRYVKRIVLDVSGTGIRYQAGDRCSILPENSDALVEKTLRALGASGDEPISLDSTWRRHVKLRDGHADAQVLSLRLLLRFGRIRPVERDTMLRLYSVSQDPRLRTILNAWAQDQWELWDLLDLMAERNFLTRRLWQALPGDREHICRIVTPERYRLYSISSVMEQPDAASADEIHLTVGGMKYETAKTHVSRSGTRSGTGSGFLARLANDSQPSERRVAIRVVHPPRFALPRDPARSVVMFAGGTGLAPMKSLIAERARTPDSGENVLFFGTRTRDDFYYQEEFAALEAAGLLKARVAFSRDDIEAHFDSQQGAYRLEDAERHRVDAVILREENARYIWDMLRSPEEGGSGAYFYLCGRTAFATSILNAIKSIIARFNEGASPEENGRILYELVGQGRFCLEIFTTYAGRHFDDEKQKIPVSAVVRRNNDQDGYWVIINGRVYDMTEFGHIHAGGMKIVQSYSGMDGTYAYQKVGHDVNPEVDAMLGMYELGVLAMPNFDSRWGVAVGLEGLQYISLRDAYQAWAKLAFMVVEMENAVMNDFRTLDEPMTEMENDGVPRITPFKVNQIALAHDRLVNNYLAQVVGEPLSVLWSLTSGLLGETRSGSDWMKDAMESVQQSEAAKAAQALHVRMSEAILADERRLSDFEDAEHRYGPMCRWLAERDQHAIRQLKLTLCEGLEVFETLQAETVSSGGPRLMTILKRFPQVLGEFYDRLAEGEERLSV